MPSPLPRQAAEFEERGDGGYRAPEEDYRGKHIADWEEEDVGDFVESLKLEKYRDNFVENEITGDLLIHLNHDELRELGIISVGHRINILKHVYEVKLEHGVPIEAGHYVPVSADAAEDEKTVTQYELNRLMAIIKQRDSRLLEAERDIHDLLAAMDKLKKELAPVFRMSKARMDRDLPPAPMSADLPREHQPSTSITRDRSNTTNDDEEKDPTPPNSGATLQAPTSGRSLSRKFSMKKLILGNPKNPSPTHPNHPEYDPPSAGMNGSSSMAPPQLPPIAGGSIMTPAEMSKFDHPSPTSPAAQSPYHSNVQPTHSSIATLGPPPLNSAGREPRTPREDRDHSRDDRDREHKHRDRGREGSGDGGGSNNNSVEIFKSFRVSMDDPCYKVLPAALKRYNIQADWRQYALYIVHGDQERCLGLEERPLILFKQLDREGRKPMFMLRRNGGTAVGGDGGFQVPGGVL